MTFTLLFLLFAACCAEATNYVYNPSFELGKSGWGDDYHTASIVSTYAHTGNYSLFIEDTSTTQGSGVYQIKYASTSGMVFGLTYRLSAWIRMQNTSAKTTLLVSAESSDYTCTLYAWNSANASCADGTCDDQWYFITATSLMPFKNWTYYLGIGIRGTGRAWVDDVVLEYVPTYILRTVEVVLWRQEVFDADFDILVDLLVKNTAFENGDHLNIRVDFVSQATGSVVDSVTGFSISKRVESFAAVLHYNRTTSLPAGFYTVRAVVENQLFGITETSETNLHKLSSPRTYGIYVDKDNRCIDHGKPFFPLGLYAGSLNNTDIDLIANSPINLVLHHCWNSARVDFIYSRSKGRIRVIDRVIANKYTYSSNITLVNSLAEEVANYALSIKNSSGLFGYYLADEPGTSAIPSLRANTLAIREVDHDHVVWPAINNRLWIHKYKEAFDASGIDIYPVQHYDDLTAVYTCARQARDRVINNRALWDIVQIFDWTVYGHSNESPPTLEQLRQMTYQMVAGGAMGIIFFAFEELHAMNYKNPFYTEWNKILSVTNELVDNYVPIILSNAPLNPHFDLPTWAEELDHGRNCAVRFFHWHGRDFVLAVNPWPSSTKTCTFGKPSTAQSIIKMTGDSTVTTVDSTTLQLTMPAMDVTWLKIYDPSFQPAEEDWSDGGGDGGSDGVSTAARLVSSMIVTASALLLL